MFVFCLFAFPLPFPFRGYLSISISLLARSVQLFVLLSIPCILVLYLKGVTKPCKFFIFGSFIIALFRVSKVNDSNTQVTDKNILLYGYLRGVCLLYELTVALWSSFLLKGLILSSGMRICDRMLEGGVRQGSLNTKCT